MSVHFCISLFMVANKLSAWLANYARANYTIFKIPLRLIWTQMVRLMWLAGANVSRKLFNVSWLTLRVNHRQLTLAKLCELSAF